MGRGSVRVACAVEDPELRARVEDVLRALGVECADPPHAATDPFRTAAVVVEAASPSWDACVAALRSCGPAVPHVVLVQPGRSAALLDLLKDPEATRSAIHAVVDVDPALGERLTEILAPMAAWAIRRGPVAVIAALLAGGDPHLEEFVVVALEAPARRTTVKAVWRAVKAPTKAVRRAVVRCGLAPPSRLLRAVRVMGAHALLVDGASVEATAQALGYSSPDVLRDHFRRTVGTTPSEARALSTEELASRLQQTG